ncbi:MAG: hypothetical protein MJ252_21765 [archaeon]|nr:hypothetical protein [archaeon]
MQRKVRNILLIFLDRVIPYQSCYHLGNEVCNEHCPCSARGFCEKYCACNKSLCKLKWTGCHCKGPCNSLQCPCCANNRECDYDLCLSKKYFFYF